jgi:hypothetical protein
VTVRWPTQSTGDQVQLVLMTRLALIMLMKTWYVSFKPGTTAVPPRRPSALARHTENFDCEADAKAFARARLQDASDVRAGTLNPHSPKRVVSSAQVRAWLEEAGAK